MQRFNSLDLLARLFLAMALATTAACGDDGGTGDPLGDDDDDDDDDIGGPAGGLQLGDGTPESMVITTLWTSPDPREATDLDFDPVTGRLWVTLREFYEGLPCTSTNNSGCDALEGSTVELVDPTGSDAPLSEWKRDTNAWHFMRRPTSIAFGVEDRRPDATPGESAWFATAHEFRTGNLEDNAVNFIGPSHWTSDPAVYPFTGPGGNGSHLDMLHATPFGMGIAHQRDAVYWVLNGNVGSVDRYDFVDPHVPGGADHSDGIIHRYAEGSFVWVPNIMSHMDFDSTALMLYVADAGNGRVARVDTSTGTRGLAFSPIYEELADAATFTGVTVDTVVGSDQLDTPSGLDISGDELFVTDNATSVIYAFSLQGELLNQYDTGLPTGSLGGLVVGPDDRVYFINRLNADVYRLDPAGE